jgi:uncharacterized C2H2 Zn-finger protein
LLCSATRVENDALIQSNIEITSSIPASQLATLSFINYCDAAATRNPALYDLLQMKGMTFHRWPAPALSVLSQIAFPLLILLFLESENMFDPVTGDVKVLQLPGYPVTEETPGNPEIRKFPGFSPESCELPSEISEIVGIRGVESQCPLCQTLFRDDEAVLKHLLQYHVEMQSIVSTMRTPTTQQQTHKCLKCREVFEKYTDFIEHIVECHREALLKAAKENKNGAVVVEWIGGRMTKSEKIAMKEEDEEKYTEEVVIPTFKNGGN